MCVITYHFTSRKIDNTHQIDDGMEIEVFVGVSVLCVAEADSEAYFTYNLQMNPIARNR